MVAFEIPSFPNFLSRIGIQSCRSMGSEMYEYPATLDYRGRGGVAVHGVAELRGLVLENQNLAQLLASLPVQLYGPHLVSVFLGIGYPNLAIPDYGG